MGALLAPNDAEVERTARSLFAQHGSQALGIAQRAAINVRGLGMTDQVEFWMAVAVAIRTMLNEGPRRGNDKRGGDEIICRLLTPQREKSAWPDPRYRWWAWATTMLRRSPLGWSSCMATVPPALPIDTRRPRASGDAGFWRKVAEEIRAMKPRPK